MFRALLCITALSLAPAAFANDAANPPKISGTWTTEGTAQPATWVIDENGDSIQITHKQGAETIADFKCNTLGKDCMVKDSGKKATVSMWFNGPKLVEMETKGADVTKLRFSVAAQGDAMDIEVIPITPAGATETVHLKRVPVSAKNQ